VICALLGYYAVDSSLQHFGTNYQSHLQGSRNPRRKLVHTLSFCKFTGLTQEINSLGPFNGWKHQRFSTTQTCHQAVLHDVQEDKGKKEAAANHSVSAKKRKTLNK
jgi:hypothetical protein